MERWGVPISCLVALGIAIFWHRSTAGEWNLWIQPLSPEAFLYYNDTAHQRPFHAYDACFDLVVPRERVVVCNSSREWFEVPYEIRVAIFTPSGKPSSYYLIARSSILDWSSKFRVSGHPGVMDAGYRGELSSRFLCSRKSTFGIPMGTRLVQVCTPPLEFPTAVRIWNVDTPLPAVDTRGEKRFGSTNIWARLFPDVPPSTRWKLVDLGALHNGPVIVADLEAQKTLLERAAETKEVCTYGGLGEDRNALWFGHEQNERSYAVHLGVDFNNLVPGTPVHSLTDGTVIDVLLDMDAVNGWGGRVIVETRETDQSHRYVLYGHLALTGLPSKGSIIRVGARIGAVGAPTENGGWFPHLHLQYMTSEYVRPFLETHTLHLLDGYHFDAAPTLPPGILDPMRL